MQFQLWMKWKENQKQDTAIIELLNPIYGINKNTLRYDIVLDNATSINLPNEFGQSTLVIDALTTAVNSHITDSVT